MPELGRGGQSGSGPSTTANASALRTTFDLAPIGLAQFDAEGRFLLVNDRLCEILGCGRDYALARTFQELTFPDDLPRCLELTAKLAANELPNYCVEKRFVRRDDSVIWARITVSAARKADGAVDYFIGAAEDITAQVEATRALAMAEERLRTATDASGIGTFRFDVRRSAMEWADGMQRVFGTSTAVSLEQFFDRIHPDDREQVMRAYLQSVNDGSEFEEEFRSVWPDGSLHWLHDRGRIYPGEDGRAGYIIGAITDVTHFKTLEEALRRNEAQFRALADGIPQLAWISDADGSRSWFNARWCSYFGCAPDDMLGMEWLHVHDPEASAGILASQRRAFRHGNVWEGTVRLRRKDGNYRWFLSRAMPVGTADGAPVRWIGTNTDITDQLESERKLADLLEAEQAARQMAEHARSTREQVLGLVAHDLRNPVHTILMASGAMLEIPFSEEDRTKHLELIKRCAWTMERLITDLLDVHRIDAGTFAVKRERIDVAPIAEEVCERFREPAVAAGVALTGRVAPKLPPILGDRERLVQALSNLVSNALRFTPQGGRIEIDASAERGKLRLTVHDTGAGIPPEQLPAVFHRFWQGDRTSGGAGLGLAIVKGIVESHDGAIQVESRLSEGSTFSLTLPFAGTETEVEAGQ
jgi:PAS domain S-box-containing protein